MSGLGAIALQNQSLPLHPQLTSASGPGYAILLGYAKSGGGGDPTPWPPTTTKLSQYSGYKGPYGNYPVSAYTNLNGSDTGAIMILNTSGAAETISNLHVTFPGATAPPTVSWSPQSIGVGTGEVYGAYGNTTFDTSDVYGLSNCSSPHVTTAPEISFSLTTGGVTTVEHAYDTGLILDTGGCDPDTYEMTQWLPIGAKSPLGGAFAYPENVGTCSALDKAAGPLQNHYSDPVNTEDGGLDASYSGFSANALGHALDFNLSYDSQLAQNTPSGNYPGPFGFGWSDDAISSLSLSNAPPYANSTSTTLGTEAKAICGGGAQETFDAASSAGLCVAPTGNPPGLGQVWAGEQPDSNPTDLMASFCALPRVTAQLSYYGGCACYVLGEDSGLSTSAYTYSGQLGWYGTPDDGNFVNVSYDVAPGSGGCPSSSTYSWLANGGFCDVYTDAANHQMAIGINAYGFSAGVWDVNGTATTNEWAITYDSNLDLASITDPLGHVTSYSYNTTNPPYDHELATRTDPLGSGTTCATPSAPTHTTCFAYDTSTTDRFEGQITSVTDPLGNQTAYSYAGTPSSGDGGYTIITDPLGNAEEDFYSYGEFVSSTVGYGTAEAATTSYVYDPNTLMRIETIQPDGVIDTDAYDARGNLCWSAPGDQSASEPATAPYSCSSLTPAPPPGATVYAYNNYAEQIAGTSARSNTVSTGFDMQGKVRGRFPNPPNGSMLGLEALACPSTSDCYAGEQVASTQGSALFASTNGGTTWSPGTSPAGIGGVTSITCLSTTACLATITPSSGAGPVLVLTTNSGASWAAVSASGAGSLYSTSCPYISSSSATCFLSGITTSGVGAIYTAICSANCTTGPSFTISNPPTYTGPSGLLALTGISCASTTNCVAVGAEGTSNGATKPIDVFTTNGTFGAPQDQSGVSQLLDMATVTCTSTTACVAAGVDTSEDADIVTLAWSSKNNNWTATSRNIPSVTTHGPATGVACPSSTYCYVSGTTTTGTGYVLASTNGGTNWTNDTMPAGLASLGEITCSSTTSCVAAGTSAGGSGDVLTTSNGGTNWSTDTSLAGMSKQTYYMTGCRPVGGYNNCSGQDDVIGELASTTDANGYTTTYDEDLAGDTIDSSDPYGDKTTFSYDPFGNQTETTSPKGNVSGAVVNYYTRFSAFNEISQRCWSAQDESSTYSFTDSCASPPSNASVPTYDADGNVTNVQDPPGPSHTTYSSTAYDQDARACWTAPSKVTNPSCSTVPAGATTFSYDADGNRTKVVDADGNTTTWTYANSAYPNVVTARVLPSYSSGEDFYYYDAAGRLSSEVDPRGVATTFGYDASGREVGTYPNVPIAMQNFASISCPSSTICAMAGRGIWTYNTSSLEDGRIFYTTNSGQSFAVMDPAAWPKSVADVSCASTTVCVALGMDSSGNPAIWSFNGGSWTTDTLPTSPAVTSVTKISCPTTTVCMALGTGGTSGTDAIAVSGTYANSTWTWSSQDLTSALSVGGLNGVTCVSATSCIVIGTDTSGNADMLTAAYGTSWTWTSVQGYLPKDSLAAVSCATTTDCAIVGADPSGNGVVLYTTNLGGSFTIDTVPSGTGLLRAVSCVNATSDYCYAAGATTSGNPTIIYTANGGWSWSAQSPPLNTDPETGAADQAVGQGLYAIACVSVSECYVAGISNAGSAELDVTTNSGASWASVSGLAPDTFTFDPDGLRTQMVDKTGTTTYSYDTQDRTVSVQDVSGATTTTVSYGYDADSNVTCIAYAGVAGSSCAGLSRTSNDVVGYGYDEDSRMTSMTDWLGTSGNVTSFGYDADSNLQTVTYPSGTGLAQTLGYDTLDNLNSIATGSSTQTYTRPSDNGTGNSLLATYTPPGGTAESYSYDTLNRTTQATGATFAYSSGGALTCETVANTASATCAAPNASYTTELYYGSSYGATGPEPGCSLPYGASTSYCSTPSTPGETKYTYGTVGSRMSETAYSATSSSTTTFNYDAGMNFACITVPNTSGYSCNNSSSAYSTFFSYSADGLRIREAPAGGTNEVFTWDTVAASVPRIITDGSHSYLYGPDAYGWGSVPFEQISGTTPTYLTSDLTGVTGVYSSSGSLGTSTTYTAYGVPTTTGTGATTSFGFEGGYEDPGGFLSFVHREYDPGTGQFLSVDPAFDMTLDAYGYAGDDPVNASDPSGMCEQTWVGCIGFGPSNGCFFSICPSKCPLGANADGSCIGSGVAHSAVHAISRAAVIAGQCIWDAGYAANIPFVPARTPEQAAMRHIIGQQQQNFVGNVPVIGPSLASVSGNAGCIVGGVNGGITAGAWSENAELLLIQFFPEITVPSEVVAGGLFAGGAAGGCKGVSPPAKIG